MSSNDTHHRCRPAEPDRHVAVRAPSQPRGQARVEAILDATAAVIAEDGLRAVTMHAVAVRAQTSTGSMYHFFSDRESLLQALAERHAAAVDKITQDLTDVPPAVWKRLSPVAVIDRILVPYVDYLKCHPDFLPLKQSRSLPSNDAAFLDVIRYAIDCRLPLVPASQKADIAAMLHAIAAGTMHMGLHLDPARADVYLRETPRVMSAYLREAEELAGNGEFGRSPG